MSAPANGMVLPLERCQRRAADDGDVITREFVEGQQLQQGGVIETVLNERLMKGERVGRCECNCYMQSAALPVLCHDHGHPQL